MPHTATELIHSEDKNTNISLASFTMGRGQVLARILYQLPPSISEHNFYLCLGKVNFFLISTPVPSRKRHILNTGSISFTCSSLPHGLKKRYPFLCYHLSITYKGRIQTSLWAKARGMQKPCLIPLQINCRKHFFFFFPFYVRAREKSMLQLIHSSMEPQ